MAFTHTINTSWGAGASVLASTVAKTGSAEQNFSLSLGTVTNQLLDMEWASAKLVSVYIQTSVDCTLKLNSSGSPTDTIALKAGVPFIWMKDSGVTYPFTGTAGAITAGYVTTTEATTLNIRTLLDL